MDTEKLVIVSTILVLLTASYLAALSAFARSYLLVGTLAYLLVAGVLVLRVMRAQNT